MPNTKFASGAFVFFRARGLEARTPDEITALLDRHPIDPAIAPSYAGDRAAVSRAIAQAASGLSRQGLLLRPLRRSSSELAYAIVREHRIDEHLKHVHEATFHWKKEPDPSVIEGVKIRWHCYQLLPNLGWEGRDVLEAGRPRAYLSVGA